jgi:cob(I)alamin adenosyltransferase
MTRSRIYTKGGDRGETGLIGGARVGKDDVRVRAYGEVDELNAQLGVVVANSSDEPLRALLSEIQKDLFAVGAHLADPRDAVAATKPKAALGEGHVAAIEAAIDERDARLSPLTSFLLPGGSPEAASLHLARAVCRRAERAIVALDRVVAVDPAILAYVNRVADLLFVLAREANARAGCDETSW